jgi:hypothetical protein
MRLDTPDRLVRGSPAIHLYRYQLPPGIIHRAPATRTIVYPSPRSLRSFLMRSWQFVDLLPRQADPCLDRITALAGSRGSAGMPTMAARDGNVARHQMVRAQAQGAVKCQRLLAGGATKCGLPRSIVDILRTFRPGRRPEGLSLVSGSHESEVIMGFSGCMVCHQRTVCVHSVDPVLLVRSGGAEMISMRRPTLQSLGRRMTRQTDRRNHFLFGCCLETAARAIRSIERPCTADAIPWCFLPKQETGDAPLQPHLARMPMIVTG